MPTRLPHLTRRTALVLTVMALVSHGGATQPSSDDMVSQIVALATDPDVMGLDPPHILRRVGFRGGGPHGRDDGARAVWDLRDDGLTLGHIEFSRGLTGWHLDLLMLIFGIDDKIPLAPVQDALTKHFGTPRDETMSPQSNTVLRWSGSDRSIRVTADVPGDRHMLVYVLRLGRL